MIAHRFSPGLSQRARAFCTTCNQRSTHPNHTPCGTEIAQCVCGAPISRRIWRVGEAAWIHGSPTDHEAIPVPLGTVKS